MCAVDCHTRRAPTRAHYIAQQARAKVRPYKDTRSVGVVDSSTTCAQQWIFNPLWGAILNIAIYQLWYMIIPKRLRYDF